MQAKLKGIMQQHQNKDEVCLDSELIWQFYKNLDLPYETLKRSSLPPGYTHGIDTGDDGFMTVLQLIFIAIYFRQQD
jgi:hypothetical protein